MKIVDKYLFLIVLLGIMSATALLAAEKQRGKPGLDPYVLTKIEWLALYFNATEKVSNFDRNYYDIGFYPKGHDTIVIDCFYLACVNRQNMNISINGIRNRMKNCLQHKGWNWVKIEESLHLLKEEQE